MDFHIIFKMLIDLSKDSVAVENKMWILNFLRVKIFELTNSGILVVSQICINILMMKLTDLR